MAINESKVKVLNDELQRAIGWFHKEADKHKSLYRCCRYSVFGVTALATVVASLAIVVPDTVKPYVNIAIVALTAISGSLASVEGLRKPAELWQNERAIEYALMDLQRESNYLSAGSADMDVDQLFGRMQFVIRGSGEKWLRHVGSAQSTITANAPPSPRV